MRQTRIEPLLSVAAAIPLLAECGLPVADIPRDSAQPFFAVRLDDALVAVVGLELHQPFGLLRSLAVAPAQRGRGLARDLVAFAESFAAAQGVDTLFLLTTSAAEFFTRLGYAPASRAAAPPAIQATAQFAGLCPASAAFLSKHLAAGNPCPVLP